MPRNLVHYNEFCFCNFVERHSAWKVTNLGILGFLFNGIFKTGKKLRIHGITCLYTKYSEGLGKLVCYVKGL